MTDAIPTPRVDAHKRRCFTSDCAADFSRQLERELIVAMKELHRITILPRLVLSDSIDIQRKIQEIEIMRRAFEEGKT